MSKQEIGALIDAYLDNQLEYPQQWNDFIECSQEPYIANAYRAVCYELDPLVSPEDPADDGTAILVLRAISRILKEHSGTSK